MTTGPVTPCGALDGTPVHRIDLRGLTGATVIAIAVPPASVPHFHDVGAIA